MEGLGFKTSGSVLGVPWWIHRHREFGSVLGTPRLKGRENCVPLISATVFAALGYRFRAALPRGELPKAHNPQFLMQKPKLYTQRDHTEPWPEIYILNPETSKTPKLPPPPPMEGRGEAGAEKGEPSEPRRSLGCRSFVWALRFSVEGLGLVVYGLGFVV